MKVTGWFIYLCFAVLEAFILFLGINWYILGGDWTSLFTPFIVIIAVIIAYRQLGHARHTRCAQLLLDVMKWWNSEGMTEGRKLIWKMGNSKDEILKLCKDKNMDFFKVLRVAEFGECLGVLVRRKYIEKKDIWLLFEYDWKEWYQDFSGVVDSLKTEDSLDTTFCNLKLLYEEMDKISR